MDDITEVRGEDNLWDLVTESSKLLIGWLERSLGLGGEIVDESGLIDLDSLGTSSLELDKVFLVDREELLEEVDWVDGLATVGFAKVKEGHWADKDRSGGNASLLGLKEFDNSLWVGAELEDLVVL